MRDCSRGSFGSTRGLGEKAAHAFCGMRCPDQVNKPSLDPPLKAFHPLTVHLVLLFLRGRFALWPFFEHLKQQGTMHSVFCTQRGRFQTRSRPFSTIGRECASLLRLQETAQQLRSKTRQNNHAMQRYAIMILSTTR